MDIGQILSKYIELRDRKAALAKEQSETMKPLNEAMDNIESYLMHTMNTMGTTQLKAEGIGTAFKATATSCQLQDAVAFKDFVFAPAVNAVMTYLGACGYEIRELDSGVIANIIRDQSAWDMVDFRAGKKGITDYVENEQQNVPGVAVNTIATINIRRN